MTITKYFLMVFITVSLFVMTFFNTQGGYLFFAQAFPIALILTCVVFIEELFNPTKKKKYIDSGEKNSDEEGMKGLIMTITIFILTLVMMKLFIVSSVIFLKSILFLLIIVSFYVLYRVFQKYTYTNMSLCVKRRITPVNLSLVIVLSVVFGMFYFKTLYLPKSKDILIRKNEYQFLTDTARRYAEIDAILAETKEKADTDEPLENLGLLYSAYIEKLGGSEVTRENVTEFAVYDWEDEACEAAYRKLIVPEYTATLTDKTLTIKFNTFFYGLSGNIYRDLERYQGQFDHLVYDLTDCRGGDIQQAIFATDPIFPINIVAKIDTNDNKRGINTKVFSSTDYVLNSNIKVLVSENTSNLGEWAYTNALALGYKTQGQPVSGDSKIYEILYVKELNRFYAFPIGRLKGIDDLEW